MELVYEVIAHYMLNRTTIWSYEVTYFLYGSHFYWERPMFFPSMPTSDRHLHLTLLSEDKGHH